MKKFPLLRILAVCLPSLSVTLFAQDPISTVGTGEYATTYVTHSGTVYTTVGNDGGYSVVAIPNLPKIIQAEGGQYSSVLRSETGGVYSVNGGTTTVTPYLVDNAGAPFSADYVQGFYRNFLALKNGELWYWSTPNTGRNTPDDILNQGHNTAFPKKLIQPPGKTLVKVVSASSSSPGVHTFAWALDSDGTIWQWDRTHKTPFVVTGYTGTARDIAMVGHNAFVVETSDKQLWAWGYLANYVGGYASWQNPNPVNVTAKWTAAGAVLPSKKLVGNYNTLHIVDANDHLFGSGCNVQGNVGNGQQYPSWRTYSPKPYQWSLANDQTVTGPVQIPGKWKDVISNNTVAFYLYGQDMGGNWYSWGRNKSRVLGNGLTMNSADEAGPSEYLNIPAPRLVTPLTQTWTVSGVVNVNANRAPVASAGINQYLPAGTTSTTLYGRGSHQQQPTASTTVTMNYSWSKISGADCQIVSVTSMDPVVNGLTAGIYVFRNTVTNSNGASDFQNVTVVVNAPEIVEPEPVDENGLLATYYNNMELAGTGVTRRDENIAFSWANGAPMTGFNPDRFSAKWEGEIKAPVTGTYTFRVGSDDGSRLWINGEKVVDYWSDHGHAYRAGTVVLEEGRRYSIRMEYYEKTSLASVELRWTVPGGDDVVVPGDVLFPPTVHGLVGTYYNSLDLTGAGISRLDANVNFFWDGGSPMAGVPANQFSAKWEGEIEAPVNGAYTFKVGSDDGSRLWIDGVKVVDNWGDHGHGYRVGMVTLEAGKRYNIKLEYYEKTSAASAELRWTAPGGGDEVVPTSALYFPHETVVPTETVSSPGTAAVLVSAVSRQSHGSAGTYDINLPLSGALGVECRQLTSGTCSVVLRFDKEIVSGTPSLIGGGSLSGAPVIYGKTMKVNLSGVSDGQIMQLSLSNVIAQDGTPGGTGLVTFRVLKGDVTGDGAVLDADVTHVSGKLSTTLNTGNAVCDVNRSGTLNTTDVVVVSSCRGNSAL